MKKSIGTGNKAAVRKPSNEVAQGTPRLVYMGIANMGKPAPTKDLMKVLLAIAEFAFIL